MFPISYSQIRCSLSTFSQPSTYPTPNAKGEQPWPKGHATRTTFNLQPSTLAKRPRYANNQITFNSPFC
ncbi:MAG: hypothetical protein F6K56_46065 [Moorea sp. SIO3G5]|nr:hypothetical protein [Moorena sp. SIO3G5]